MVRLHAWRWKRRHYTSAPGRPIQFGVQTLERLYRRWRVAAGNPDALRNRYRLPEKLRKGHVLEFARGCIDSDVRFFAEAFDRLARPAATYYAYRLRLPVKLRRRILGIFAARRLVDCRMRKARAEANRFAGRGAR
jgi:hypothetical protein